MNKTVFLVLILNLVWGGATYSQVKNGAIFHIVGGSKIQGELVHSDTNFSVKLLDGSIYGINKSSITKAYFPDEITLFANGKFNVKKGFILYTSSGAGFSGNINSLNLLGGYQFGNGFEASFGFGFQTTSFNVPVANNNFNWIFIDGYPMFISGKYFFLNDKVLKPYGKIQIGLNNYQNNSWSTSQVNNGFLMETGFGLAFSGRRRTRFFIELLQYNAKAKGTSVSEEWDWNTGTLLNSTDVNFNLWINEVVFRFGVFFQFLD